MKTTPTAQTIHQPDNQTHNVIHANATKHSSFAQQAINSLQTALLTGLITGSFLLTACNEQSQSDRAAQVEVQAAQARAALAEAKAKELEVANDKAMLEAQEAQRKATTAELALKQKQEEELAVKQKAEAAEK